LTDNVRSLVTDRHTLFGRHFTTMEVPSEALCLSKKRYLGGC
jgi:hypothetical protein